jgi:hypothetical protein
MLHPGEARACKTVASPGIGWLPVLLLWFHFRENQKLWRSEQAVTKFLTGQKASAECRFARLHLHRRRIELWHLYPSI